MQPAEELPAYRWTIVAASALILAVSMGTVVNGLSAFIVPMQALHGWDRGDIALINVAGLFGLALAAWSWVPWPTARAQAPWSCSAARFWVSVT